MWPGLRRWSEEWEYSKALPLPSSLCLPLPCSVPSVFLLRTPWSLVPQHPLLSSHSFTPSQFKSPAFCDHSTFPGSFFLRDTALAVVLSTQPEIVDHLVLKDKARGPHLCSSHCGGASRMQAPQDFRNARCPLDPPLPLLPSRTWNRVTLRASGCRGGSPLSVRAGEWPWQSWV